ncbi:hypothetical protein CA267_002720 [Alteromonas pelagimontana]|uniref:Uncharacterized protein n=1 Tax=Alteromonas pelagimontana TaxID=1858656 RepID=A0A6M4M9E2_9ALTE|nr:hypothetical protein [Alteromonas pelagimontana]QJR79783.1 hypothetical protein CA267_002720 [Alteromonas pelagimontana]
MFEYTALIYNGIAQRLIKVEAGSDADLFNFLSQHYGVYICIWYEKYAISSQ